MCQKRNFRCPPHPLRLADCQPDAAQPAQPPELLLPEWPNCRAKASFVTQICPAGRMGHSLPAISSHWPPVQGWRVRKGRRGGRGVRAQCSSKASGQDQTGRGVLGARHRGVKTGLSLHSQWFLFFTFHCGKVQTHQKAKE